MASLTLTHGFELPLIHGPIPGPHAELLVERLAAAECPALTMRRARRAEQSGADQDPIVWVQALGANVLDADGNRFVDFTSGFGAAAVGHRHPRVVAAIHAQTERMLHALGDVHPSLVKIQLLERLAQLSPWPEARVMFGLSGSDAVEAAMKTAMLHTRRPGILAFEGSYHGLSYGALAATGYKAEFREPFVPQLNPRVHFVPFPKTPDDVTTGLRARFKELGNSVGAVLIEPILGRGGVHIPAAGTLSAVAELCHDRGALLIADEVLTGLGRTGGVFRTVDEGVVPDLICVGKALGGGLPISACLGHAQVMQAWGEPGGEALHTSTFLGNPLCCAAALAALDVLHDETLGAVAARSGQFLIENLRALAGRRAAIRDVRGAGLLCGVEFDSSAVTFRVMRELLTRGYISLAAGQRSEVLQLLPPLNVTNELLLGIVRALDESLEAS